MNRVAPNRLSAHHLFNPGVAKITAAALIWGSMGILIRLVHLSPAVIVFWRGAFGSAILLAFILASGSARDLVVERRYRWLLPASGLCLTLSMAAFAKAVELTTVANAILIVYTAPVLIALLAPFFLGERFQMTTLLALALAISGIALILIPQGLTLGGRHAAGIGFASLTALGYAGLVLVSKRVVEHVRPRIVTFYELAVAIVVLAPFVIRQPLPAGARAWTILVVLGVVHSALAGLLYVSGLRSVKAQEAGILAYLEPLSAAIFGMIVLSEPLNAWVVGGGALIIAAGSVVIFASQPEPLGPAR